MDPHLPCSDIILWGDKLADPSGTFTIDGWPPSGSQEQDYPPAGTQPWVYDAGAGGSQDLLRSSANTVLVTTGINSGKWAIPVDKLINTAIAHGDTAQPQQGFHFKLQFSQDPQKHKTFWVDCHPQPRVVTSTNSSVSTATTVTTSEKTGTSEETGTSETGTASGETTSGVTTSNGTGGVGGISTSASSTKGPSGSVAGITSTPNTGTSVPFIAGLILVLVGGTFAGASSWKQRRSQGGAQH
jgi:hypothetical protein